MTFTLEQFLMLTGGTYRVAEEFSYLGDAHQTHYFSFPNGSVIASAPGETREAATRKAAEFVFSLVSLPPAQVDTEPKKEAPKYDWETVSEGDS